MTSAGWIQLIVYLGLLVGLGWPLGLYIARVLERRPTMLDRVLGPVERAIYRLCGVDASKESGWRAYAVGLVLFNALGALVLYLLQRTQAWLPLNPDGLGAVTPDSSLNTAISFATNTNWQGYGGETTMAYLVQMAGLTTQNFVSAATGIAVLAALVRGLARRSAATVGNFFVDLVRSALWVLLPLSIVLAFLLVSQGVVQTLEPAAHVALVDAAAATPDVPHASDKVLARGPAASQIAIKQLGTNGGGFFNVNSAHPFENATPLSNFLECLAILLIPGALCFTFGRMVHDMRQGWAVLAAMLLIFVPLCIGTWVAESTPNPALAELVDQAAGNLEGKEVRFGVPASALWATATTAASNGSVNSMHDSYTPLGGLVPLWMMLLGEVVFGGVGSGLYGMLVFAVVAVFIAGLMVGRTPEYVGKKIEAYEMKMASLALLAPALAVLFATAIAVSSDAGRATIFNPAAHGFSEVLYATASASNNNGSAFAGLGANTPFYNVLLGVCMWVGRYAVIVPVLAMAGSLARKRRVPAGSGTLPTHGPLFVVLLAAVVVLFAALTFFPALALGPIVEHLKLFG